MKRVSFTKFEFTSAPLRHRIEAAINGNKAVLMFIILRTLFFVMGKRKISLFREGLSLTQSDSFKTRKTQTDRTLSTLNLLFGGKQSVTHFGLIPAVA